MTGSKAKATQLYTATVEVSSFKTSITKTLTVRASSREDATIKAGYSVLDLAKHFMGDTSGIQIETISVVEGHTL